MKWQVVDLDRKKWHRRRSRCSGHLGWGRERRRGRSRSRSCTRRSGRSSSRVPPPFGSPPALPRDGGGKLATAFRRLQRRHRSGGCSGAARVWTKLDWLSKGRATLFIMALGDLGPQPRVRLRLRSRRGTGARRPYLFFSIFLFSGFLTFWPPKNSNT